MEQKIIVKREMVAALPQLTNPASPEDVAFGKQYIDGSGRVQTGTRGSGITVAVDNLTTELHPATITEGEVNNITNEMTLLDNASFVVTCDIACVVGWSDDDGETYHRMYGENVGTNAYKFTLPNEARKNGVTISVGVKGDPNGDGTPDSTDAFMIGYFADSTMTPTAFVFLLSDVNLDGVISSADVTLVQQAEIGMVNLEWDANNQEASNG